MDNFNDLARAFANADPVNELPEPQRRRVLRETAGLSQRAAAALVGTTDQTLRLWERGERQPQLARVRSYRKFLSLCERLAGER